MSPGETISCFQILKLNDFAIHFLDFFWIFPKVYLALFSYFKEQEGDTFVFGSCKD